MKSHELFTLIGEADEHYLKEAESARRRPPKRRARFLIPAIAVLLSITLLLGVFLFPSSTPLSGNYCLAAAVYPTLAPFPTDPSDSDAWDAWSESQQAQKEAYRQSDIDLDPFLSSLIPTVLSAEEGQNTLLSPLNLYMALAMAAEITDGSTRAQLLELLGYTDIETLRQEAFAVWNAHYSNDGAFTSLLASSLWLDEDLSYQNETVEQLAKTYYASIYQGQMGDEAYSQVYRNWLNENTNGLLTDSIKGIEFTSDTLLALATTITFEAKWADRFSSNQNTEGLFHSPDGNVSCEFMNASVSGTYFQGENFSAIQQSFELGGKMYFLLPDEGTSPEALLRSGEALNFILSPESWRDQVYVTIHRTIPKFDVCSDLELTDSLKALGVSDIFAQDKADFSPILPSDEAELTEIRHAVRVMIDEEGCSAAAFTSILVGATGMPTEEVTFVLDRPFIFVITSEVGLPLFVGVVNTVA